MTARRVMPECRWCGNLHAVTALCRARRVSRRLFCVTASAAAIGACLPAPPVDPIRRAIDAWRVRDAILAGNPSYRPLLTWSVEQTASGTWIGLTR